MSSEGASGEGDDDGDAGEPLFREHKLSKTDSLASIAIRYGVTTRDIKRANGGVITDATLHARASLRIPRTSLAEGAPLPGGGGVSGAAKPIATKQAAMTPALAKMREYYGTARREESLPARDERPCGNRARRRRGPARLRGRRAGGQEDRADGQPRKPRQPSRRRRTRRVLVRRPVDPRSAPGSKYGSALSGGAMPATAFREETARSCPLRNPCRVRPRRRA